MAYLKFLVKAVCHQREAAFAFMDSENFKNSCSAPALSWAFLCDVLCSSSNPGEATVMKYDLKFHTIIFQVHDDIHAHRNRQTMYLVNRLNDFLKNCETLVVCPGRFYTNQQTS